MHHPSSNLTSTDNNQNPSHSPLSYLNSPSDLPSDLPHWRSGFGNGRFTVDSGGGNPSIDRTTELDPISSSSGSGSSSSSTSTSTELTSLLTSSHFKSNSLYHPHQQQQQQQQHPPHNFSATQPITRSSELVLPSTLSISTSSLHPHTLQGNPTSPDSSSNTNPISISTPTTPSIYHHHHHHLDSLSNLVNQISDGIGPNSLPTYFGTWNDYLDPLHFGSVPSSPVHGLENGYPIHNSLLDHHPSHPFTTISSAASSTRTNLPLFIDPSHSTNQPTPFLTKSIQSYQSNLTTLDSQLSIQNLHLSNPNNHPTHDHHHPLSSLSSTTNCDSSSSIFSTLMAKSGPPSLFSASPSSSDLPLVGNTTTAPNDYSSLTNLRQPVLPQPHSRWQPNKNLLPPNDNLSQPIRKLTEDAIYVSSGTAGHLTDNGSTASSPGLFQSSSAIPLGEFEFASWHLPIKPSQHSLLGSIPGLTQDFADFANAHAEYGYIPRLVRKTSFDEILAQQHQPKRNHSRSIGEARKRNRQLPYSSGDLGNLNTNNTGNDGQANVGNLIQCLNCQTTETPLWRRDSEGRPLCNACGLFVNLHGTPRPAALSTGIIKRRNRGKNREKNGSNLAGSSKNSQPSNATRAGVPAPIHNQFPTTNRSSNLDQTGTSRSSTNSYPSQAPSL